MRTKSLLALACLAAMSCSGCADSADSIMQDTISSMKEMTTVLKTVTDEASAKAAAPKLKAISARIQDLGKRGESLKLTKEQKDALGQKYLPQLMEAMPLSEMMRVGMMNIQDKDFQDAIKSASEMKSPTP